MKESFNCDAKLDSSYKELCSIVAKINDAKFINDFFECLFTDAERKDFAERWILVKELENGTTQREIAKKYNMSLCKITRGSKELHKENSAFKKIISNANIERI